MRRLHFLRHGPTHAKTMVGWTDLPADLSDTALLRRVDDAIPKDAICVSSDLKRCSMTLDAIQNGRRRMPDDPQLREFNFGDWDNKAYAQIAAENPKAIEAFWDNPGSIQAPNGESWDQLTARLTAGIDRLLRETSASESDILISTHFGAILTQLARATDMSAKSVFSFKIDNLSITTLLYHGPKGWGVQRVNHIP
ncbi:MAG: histidine phosphatase family protein [Pseudomonadota bacterium]